MSRMIRKQIYIEPRQDAALKRRAAELGVSEAELIRRGITFVAFGPVGQSDRMEAWREIEAFIESYRHRAVPQTGRDWTRDELYDERLQRYPG